MKFNEVKDKNNKELLEMLKDLKGKLSGFSFQLSGNTLKNSSEIKKTKKDVARIMTVLKKSP